MNIFKKAFTLAEVIAVVVILGVVASITIPTTIKRTTERANKTKIIKAMAAYENMIQQVFINEGLNSIEEFKTWARSSTSEDREETDENGDNITKTYTTVDCGKILNYLNKSSVNIKTTNTKKRNSSTNCTAVNTSDGLWWNFNNAVQPIVAFKKENLTAAKAQATNTNEAFYFIVKMPKDARTPVANATDELNISDPYELMGKTSSELKNMMYMKKLYSYIGKQYNPGSVNNICVTEKCCQSTTGTCLEIYSDPSSGYYYTWLYDSHGKYTNVSADYENGEMTKYTAYIKESGNKVEIDVKKNIGKVTQNGVTACYQYNIKDKTCTPTAKGYGTMTHTFYNTMYNESSGGNWSMLLGCGGYTDATIKKVDCE